MSCTCYPISYLRILRPHPRRDLPKSFYLFPSIPLSPFQNIQNSLFRELDPINKDSKIQIPIIIRLNGDNYIQTFLNYILSKSKNLALEKFVYKGKSLESLPTAVFYMSIYNSSKTNLAE